MRLRFTGFISPLLVLLMALSLFAQDQGTVRGRITEAETGNALPGANVQLEGTSLGAASDANGNYTISNVPVGTYVLKVTYVGYATVTRTITVAAGTNELSVALTQTILEAKEVIVEVNRARERETPVAFTNIKSEDIDEVIHGQDAPLLIKGTPGVYTYATDGAGNGEAKLFIRGFDQNRVQVLINGVPTNDPESNSVYWSNWGSVSASAASIQVQRGAGSSLYGSGAFGGSFNIVTADAPAKSFYGLSLNVGDPKNTMFGVDLKTGLLNDRFAFAVAVDRKLASGNLVGVPYKGINYYTSASWYMNSAQSLKFVLHGAPQEHAYSFSNPIAFFKQFGFDANGSPTLPKSVVRALPASASGKPNFGLLDDRREIIDPNFVGLGHNFFHKPQAELHYNYDLSETSALHATFFFSMGRGAGSSLNSAGSVPANNIYSVNGKPIRNADGLIDNSDFARDVYLGGNAHQRTSFSLHQQFGLLASYDTQVANNLKLTVGGEGRRWTADHPGHYTNLYGKASLKNVTYAYLDPTEPDPTKRYKTFNRELFEGDLNHPEDFGSLFDWELAGDKDPTFRTQYRNYYGKTPQFTLFVSGNLRVGKANIVGTLQRAGYEYQLRENMPSENAIGTKLAAPPASGSEGPAGGGKFYMKDVNGNFYVFTLVNETRRRGFWQPKIGVNYNANDNLNIFGNFAHVERFTDLGAFYNRGIINPDAEDEKSNQFEAGLGWRSGDFAAKLNGYTMTWENKTTQIRDPSKAGQIGFDYQGRREELVGEAQHRGIEFEMEANLNRILPIKGFNLRGSATMMSNEWKDILPQAAIDQALKNAGVGQEDANLNGKLDTGEDANASGKLDENRRVFSPSALDKNGATDALYFIELKDQPVASKPQTILSVGLTYRNKGWFAGFDVNHYARDFGLDGASFIAVDAAKDPATGTFKVTKFSDKLPSRTVMDAQAGYRFDFGGLKINASVQVLNVFDKEYLADVDRFGVIPGYLRTFRFNLSTGI